MTKVKIYIPGAGVRRERVRELGLRNIEQDPSLDLLFLHDSCVLFLHDSSADLLFHDSTADLLFLPPSFSPYPSDR